MKKIFTLLGLLLLFLLVYFAGFATGHFFITESTSKRCYWMENTSGQFTWIEAEEVYHRKLSERECYELNSCGSGLGNSGGGCYKWSTNPEGEAENWENFQY